MVGFLKKLFGGGADGGEGAESATATEEHGGCQIRATPENSGGAWRVAGVITKEIDGEIHERVFIRADTFASQDEAANFTMVKARQIIDQNGARLFASGEKTGSA